MVSKYKRVLLKISGEALAGSDRFGLNTQVMDAVIDHIKSCVDAGVQMGIVVGGGNFWRGRQGANMDRAVADYMGMLATAINALALQDAFEKRGISTRVQSSIEMRAIAEPYIRKRAIRHLEKGRIVIFACGLGSPFFSTDTAAALRAVEIDAEVILLAKKVDGVYTDDPEKNPNATKYDSLTYEQVLAQKLAVMDSTATSLCMDNHIPILVFPLGDGSGIIDAIFGEKTGTIVSD